MSLQQDYIPPYNYCICCGIKIKNGVVTCAPKCWRKVEFIHESVSSVIKKEKEGYKRESYQVSRDFNNMQYQLSK